MKRLLDILACTVAASCVAGCLWLYTMQAVTMSVVTPTAMPVAIPAEPLELPRITLYLFTQPGCAPCQRLKASLRDPKCQKWLDKRFKLVEVDVTTKEWNPTLRVTSTPTLIIVGKKDTYSQVGYQTPRQLDEWLTSVSTNEGTK